MRRVLCGLFSIFAAVPVAYAAEPELFKVPQRAVLGSTFEQPYPTLVRENRRKNPAPARPSIFAADDAVRGVIADLRRGGPASTRMTPEAAARVGRELERAKPTLKKFGDIKGVSLRANSVEPSDPVIFHGEPQKLDALVVEHVKGVSVWHIFVRPDGLIGRLVLVSTQKK
jgi:hypothetical protein